MLFLLFLYGYKYSLNEATNSFTLERTKKKLKSFAQSKNYSETTGK